MGLSSWFRDLGGPWKISVGILGSLAAVTSAYGLYLFYIHHKEQSKDEQESYNDEIAGETTEKKVLVLGLENAGKSTFLAALAQQDSLVTSQRQAYTPTEGFHVVRVVTEGVSLNIWEIGGKVQSYWPKFVTDTSIIVYVVDSSNPGQFENSKKALLDILSDFKLKGVPLVLLAWKQDLNDAKPAAAIASFFELDEISKERPTGIAAFEVLADGNASRLQEAKQLILNICK